MFIMTAVHINVQLLNETHGIFHPQTAATVEKECLAVKLGVQAFRVYLLGCPFTVETDHRALTGLHKYTYVSVVQSTTLFPHSPAANLFSAQQSDATGEAVCIPVHRPEP